MIVHIDGLLPRDPIDSLDGFLRFFENWASAEDVERCPPSAELLSRCLSLLRVSPPPLYVEYLAAFGGAGDAFELFGDASGDVRSLIEYCEDGGGVPDFGVVVAVDGLCGGRALVYSDCVCAGEPGVYVCWDGVLDYPCAANFRNLLFSRAFIRGGFREQVLCGFCRTGGAGGLVLVERALVREGFFRYWFSDAFQVCVSRRDGSMVRVEAVGSRLVAYCSVPGSDVVEMLLKLFVSELGFMRSL